MNITFTPWGLGLLTACWFGFMAFQAGRNWAVWGLVGGIFGLVISTYIFGLCHAVAIPFSDHHLAVLHIKWTVVSLVVVGALGWLFTLGLHRQHISIWKRIGNAPSAPAGDKGALAPPQTGKQVPLKQEPTKPPPARS